MDYSETDAKSRGNEEATSSVPLSEYAKKLDQELKKNGKDQNSISCTKKNSFFLVSRRNDNVSTGCAT